MFVDRVQIELTAGKGGDGCTSFRREKYVPNGGPDGGNGGDGGSIIFQAETGVNSLATFATKKFFNAAKGKPGEGSGCHGRNADDLVLLVPPGTAVIDAEHGFVIRDLVHPGDSFVIARGGKGGKGNTHFKTATNRAPREHGDGEFGETRKVILELKSIADVGLIGKPNAGKSTLLSRITSARPEIADYPFTTKHPNLGIVDVSLDRSFVVADIPGLIEGASEGVGLGHEFLRHVERAGLLVHLIEPSPMDQTDPLENYNTIRDELTEYDASLGDRDEILVVTKSELPGANEVAEALHSMTGREVFRISAMTGEGLSELVEVIMSRVTQRRAQLHAVGMDSPSLRPADDERTQVRSRRVPPHLAGPMSKLSNQNQPRDYGSKLPASEQPQ
jgi:GTPase